MLHAYHFCTFLVIFIAILGEIEETSAHLLPPFGPNSRAHSTKDFRNGVVSCGQTFCDPEKCVKLKHREELTYVCNE